MENEFIQLFLDESRDLEPLPEGLLATMKVMAKGASFAIQSSRMVIGRGGDVDIHLDDPKVSENHAAIGYFDGFFFVLDLHSKNGTFVNEVRISEKALQDGDQIRFGQTMVEFHVQDTDTDTTIRRWTDKEPDVKNIMETMFGDRVLSQGDPTRLIIAPTAEKTAKAPRIEIKLKVEEGVDARQAFRFVQDEIIIGRESGDIALSDPDVSRRHAQIEVFGKDMIFLKDLDSTNGTYVNNRKIDRLKLATGDLIRIGSTILNLKIGKVVEAAEMKLPAIEVSDTAQASRAHLTLKIVSGSDLGKRFEVTPGNWSIGGNDADIRLKGHDIEEQHARLEFDGTSAIVVTEEGTVYVNKKPVAKCAVAEDDQIRIGGTVLKVLPSTEQDPSVTRDMTLVDADVE